MQHENRSYHLTSRMALVAALGLALLGTPAIAFADEGSVPLTSDEVATQVQGQASASDGQEADSQEATRVSDSGKAAEDAKQQAPDSSSSSQAEASSAASGETPNAGEQKSDSECRDGASQQQAAQDVATSDATQSVASSAATDASTPSAQTASTETSAAVSASAVTTAEESTDKVAMYRLYNRYNGEHLFTSSSSEAESLISLGWTGESVAWFSPSLGTKVYRLYNRYSGDHHYTTDKSEYDYLGSIGWNMEGVGFYSDDSKATTVYRLFNPYVTVATHHYTTSQSEYSYLGTLGWVKEGKGWFGSAMPADGWYVTPTGDEILVSGGAVKADAVVTNESGQSRYLTPAGFVAKASTWVSPSNGYTYVTSSDGTITQAIAPNAGLDYCWLKSSPYWSGAGAVKELLLNTHYSRGRFGQSISKIVIHHNAGNLTTEGCYYTWQTRPASAHYQVEANGTVGQLVLDSNTAWHAGNWTINTQTIGIEHADYKDADGNWRMTEETINSGARLVAAICLQYNLGRPQWGVNVVGHNECSSTECPASLAVRGSQHDEYIAKAQEWYDKLSKL